MPNLRFLYTFNGKPQSGLESTAVLQSGNQLFVETMQGDRRKTVYTTVLPSFEGAADNKTMRRRSSIRNDCRLIAKQLAATGESSLLKEKQS